MKGDLQFGLILLLAVALVTAPRAIPSADPTDETAANSASGEPAPLALPKGGALASQSPVPILPEAKPAADPVGEPTKRPEQNALTDISPQGYAPSQAPKAPEIESRTHAQPNSPPTERPADTGRKGKGILDWMLPSALAGTDAAKANDAAAEPSKDDGSRKTKGPIHPFFQRYLDRGEYFVREGDTLRDIALRLYQDESMVGELLRRNPALLTSAEDLRPGMMLRLPKP